MKRWLTKLKRNFLSHACLLVLIFAVIGLAACGSSGGSSGEGGGGGRPLLFAPAAVSNPVVKTRDGVWWPLGDRDMANNFRNNTPGFDPLLFPFHVDYTYWILKSQRDMALDEPITNTLHIGSHNAGNAWRYRAKRFSLVGPNQTFQIPEVLSVGARYVELDAFIWNEALGKDPVPSPRDYLVVAHHKVEESGYQLFRHVLGDVRRWLDRAEERNEIVIIDVEDNLGDDANQKAAQDFTFLFHAAFIDRVRGGTLIFTPDDLATRGGVWPSRRELIEAGKRVVILSDRAWRLNGDSTRISDDIAFKFRGVDAKAEQVGVSDYSFGKVDDLRLIENENDGKFLVLQGDSQGTELGSREKWISCLISKGFIEQGQLGQPRLSPGHVQLAVENNVNVLKMDFLLAHNFHVPGYSIQDLIKEHTGLPRIAAQVIAIKLRTDCNKEGKHITTSSIREEMWDLPGIEISYERFRQAAWSWEIRDPASIRGAYNDLFEGDSTGQALLNRHQGGWAGALFEYGKYFPKPGQDVLSRFVEFNKSAFRHQALWPGDMAIALANGRDVAFQRPFPDAHWNSAAPDAAEYAFALRTISRFDKISGNETVTPDMNDPFTMERADGPGGAYLWRRSILRDTWDKGDGGIFYPSSALVDEIRQLNLETGTRWFFAGPINGFQNATLRNAPTPGAPEPVWIKVDDLDLDGHWKVGTEPPPLIRVYDKDEDKYYFTPTMPPEAGDWWQAEAHCAQLSIDRFMGLDRWRQANASRAFRFVGLAEKGTYWTRHRHGNEVKGTVAILPDMEKETKLKVEQAVPLCVAELEAEHEFPFIPPGIEKHPVTAHPPLSLTSEKPRGLG